MEALTARHRKEQRDLQSIVTQKKKGASKKTRKTVNLECDQLEQELRAKQDKEKAAVLQDQVADQSVAAETLEPTGEQDDDVLASILQATQVGDSSIKAQPVKEDSEAGSTPGQKKQNRQKARLARRAAEHEAMEKQATEEAANLPDLKKRERDRMLEEFKKRSFTEKEVAANGHCLYLAAADQIKLLDLRLDDTTSSTAQDVEESSTKSNTDHLRIRRVVANYILHNPDDFLPFLEEGLDEYVRKVRDTSEWGGQPELLAIARSYKLRVNVLQGDGRVETIIPDQLGDRPDIWLAYYRHGFGLGEHYNSLRKNP